MKKLFTVILIILLFGCKKSAVSSFDEMFSEEHQLVSHLMPIAPDDIQEPVLILCVGDYLVCTNHGTKKILTVYDKNTGTRLNDLIYIGRAENEISDVSSIWADDSSINVFSSHSRKLLKVPLNGLTLPYPEITAENIESTLRGLTSLNTNKNHVAFNVGISRGNILQEDQFILLDAEVEPLFSFEKYPETAPMGFEETAHVFQGRITPGSNYNSFVYGSYFGLILKFFTVSDDKVTKNNEYIVELPKYRSNSDPSNGMFSVIWDKDCIRGVSSIAVGPDNYFVLCDPYLNMVEDRWMVSMVYEFDLFGKPLRKYRLDRNVGMITYDDDEGALIAFTQDDSGNYHFLSYPLF